jgi:anti-sigma28 factor (negative regulator of flagellin synthesis)
MTVNEIRTGGILPPNPGTKPGSTSETRKSSTKSDKVELSAEARSLLQSEQTQQTEQIQQRIDTGFYDTPEVREKIAEAVLKDLKGAQ